MLGDVCSPGVAVAHVYALRVEPAVGVQLQQARAVDPACPGLLACRHEPRAAAPAACDARQRRLGVWRDDVVSAQPAQRQCCQTCEPWRLPGGTEWTLATWILHWTSMLCTAVHQHAPHSLARQDLTQGLERYVMRLLPGMGTYAGRWPPAVMFSRMSLLVSLGVPALLCMMRGLSLMAVWPSEHNPPSSPAVRALHATSSPAHLMCGSGAVMGLLQCARSRHHAACPAQQRTAQVAG